MLRLYIVAIALALVMLLVLKVVEDSYRREAESWLQDHRDKRNPPVVRTGCLNIPEGKIHVEC